jgi:cephalosporin-C deacetylase
VPRFDLPLPELESYRPDVREPADFDAFWTRTLTEARSVGGDVTLTPVKSPLRAVDVFDVTFPGFAGDPVKGWLLLPSGAEGPLPAVIEYNGYGGGRGLPHERLGWAASGYAYFFMDTRGQGSGWGSGGSTADPHGSGPATPGFMTRGIEHPDDYYYRRVFTDAVRAVEAVRSHPAVDPARVVAAGGSQGGSIALAVAALVPDVAGVLCDVPFLTDVARAVEITDAEPYVELAYYLGIHRDKAEQVFRTLSYFDGAVLARRASTPALFSVGLADVTCPPSTVYAAYNNYAGPKRICVYPYNGHDAGQGYHAQVQLRWLRETLRPG